MSADIDIDFADRNKALLSIAHIQASMVKDGEYRPHNSGVYFQDIPVNPFNQMSSITYQDAEKLGYFKVDFLNNSIYNQIRDEEHLNQLRATEPNWDLLADKEFVSLLAHIHNHFDVVDVIKPKSVIDLAVCLALIRPGKRHLLNKSRAEIDADIWVAPTDGSFVFKKSHSVSYAVAITVQMNLIVEQALTSDESL